MLDNSVAGPAHILFLIDTFYGGTGGAEGVLTRIVRHLPRARYRCSVITFAGDLARSHAAELDCPFQIVPLERIYDAKAFRAALGLRRYIRENRVDLVHSFFETADLWGAPIAKLSGARLLVSSRRDMGILRKPKHRLFYRLLGPIYDQVQAVSGEVGAYAVRQDHLDPSRVVTVYNGIEAERFDADAVLPVPRRWLGVADASHVILSVGNLRRVKGFDTLVDAAAIVCRQFPRACFVIAGNPHEEDFHQQLLQRRAALGLERNVIFLGRRTDVANLMAASDIFFLPSRSEGLSNALLEAMASRLPVVATSVGGNPEVVQEGVSGFLTGAEDAAAMAARLMELLADPVQAAAMGMAGRAVVESRFTVEAMVARMCECYDALLSR